MDETQPNSGVQPSFRHQNFSRVSMNEKGPSDSAQIEARQKHETSGSDSEALDDREDEPPDGGFRAWLVVFGAWCSMFCTYGWLNSAGTFQSYYQLVTLKDYTASEIAWIPSLLSFSLLAAGPIVGRIFDRYGPQPLIIIGSFFHVFGLMMASISTKYYQLILSQGVCSALGVCAIYQPCFFAIPSWFKRRRGLAYGLASTGSSIGGVIFPIMTSRLINMYGYGWAMRISTFLMIGLLVIVNLTIKTYKKPDSTAITLSQLRQPFTEVPMLILMFGYFLLGFGVFVPSNYSIINAIHDGMNIDLSQYLLPILNASSFFGRLAAGTAADFVGVFNVMIVSCYAAGLVVLALWIPASTSGAHIAFAVVFGFAIGAYETLVTNVVAQIYPLKEIGYRNGVMFLLTSVACLVTNPVAGAIQLREGGSYIGMKVFAGVMLLAGCTLIMIIRFHFTKWKLLVRF